jgi:hypothetical protein
MGSRTEPIQVTTQNKQEKQIENLSTIVGDINESIEEKLNNIENVFGKGSIISTAIGLNVSIEHHLNVISNMIVAIAALLYGEKGVKPGDNFSSLVGKMKAAEQINNLVKEATEKEENIVEEPVGPEATINIVISGIDKTNTEELISFLEVLKQVNGSNIETITNVENLIQAIDTFKIISEKVAEIDASKLNKASKDIIGSNLPKVFEMFQTILGIRLNWIEVKLLKKSIDRLADLIKDVFGVNGSLADLKVHKPVINSLENVKTAVDLLGKIITSINSIQELEFSLDDKFVETCVGLSDKLKEIISKMQLDEKETKKAQEAFKPIESIFKGLENICIAATVIGVLAIPAMIGMFLLIPVLLVFKKFILPRLAGMSLGDKETKLSFEGADNLGKLLLVMTGSLLIGAVFMALGLAGEAFKFLIFMSLYLVMVCVVMSVMKTLTSNSGDTLTGFAVLIASLTLCLIIGAIFMMSGLWVEALKFGAILTLFTIIIGFALNFIRAVSGEANIVGEFAKLIFSLTLCLIIGALFMKMDGFFENALKFGILLAGFVFLVSISITLMGALVKNDKVVGQFVTLIITVSSILIIGALLMYIDDFGLNALLFAGLVFGFIALIGAAVILLTKFANGGDKLVMMLSIMIGVITFSLLIGASFMAGGYVGPALEFIGLSALLIVTFSAIAFGLSYIAAPMLLGILAMGATAVVIMLIGMCIGNINDIINEIGDFDSFSEGLIGILGSIWSISWRMTLLAPLAPLILAGALAIGAVSTTIDLVADAIESIYDAMKKSPSKENIETFFKGAEAMFDGVLDLPFVKLTFAAPMIKSIDSVTKVIGRIARTIATIASLKVATSFDKDGNPISFVNLTEKHFTDANTNVGKIITGIGQTIIDIYNEPKNKDLFKVQSNGLFGSKTIFSIVATSIRSLGSMLSGIATGISNFASMRVADKWDKDGKPIHFVPFNFKTDVESMGTFLNTLLTSLAGTIKEVYDKNPALFESSNWFTSETPFSKVVKSTTAIGDMLSGITQGIIDISSGRIPDDWDPKTNKPTHWISINDYIEGEEGSKLQKSITTICSALLNAVIKASESIKMDPDDIKDFTDSILPVADSIIKVSDAIKKVSEIKIDENAGTKIQKMIVSIVKAFNTVDKKDGLGDELENYIFKHSIDDGIRDFAKLLDKDRLSIICDGIKLLNDNVSEFNKVENTKDSISNFSDLIEKLGEINPGKLQKLLKLDKASNGVSKLVKEINSIDVSKTDKFIELSNALSELSSKMEAMDNGIFTMLNQLSVKLNEAAKIIERSDELQDKRIKSVKEQAKEISKLIDKPMKLEFKAEEQNSLGDKFKSIFKVNDNKEENKQDKQKQQVQKEQPSRQYDNSAELTSLAGTVSEIQALLYQILQQRG